MNRTHAIPGGRAVHGTGARGRAVAALVLAACLGAFAPRGSQTLAFLAEDAQVVALARVRERVTPSPPGASFRLDVEQALKGSVPGGTLVLWIPATEDGISLAPGQRAIFFLSEVPDRPVFRDAGATGKGLWRIAGSEAGVVDPALIGPLREILSALGERHGGRALLGVLVRHAGDNRERVREDAAADLERRCPEGRALDAPARARLRALAAKAPKESAYRRSLLSAAGSPADVGGAQ